MSSRALIQPNVAPFSALILARDEDALLLNKLLESHGFTVARAKDVSSALALCKTVRFDLAVYSQEVNGALDLAGGIRPTSQPRVVVGLLTEGEGKRPPGTQLHFIVRKPLTADLFSKTLKAAYGQIAADRRASLRLEVNIPVASYNLHDSGEARILKNGAIVNLSQTGMCLQASEMLPQNVTIEASFELLESHVVVKVAGRIVWAHASGRCGIKFDPLNIDERRKLDDWMDSMMLGRELEFKG